MQLPSASSNASASLGEQQTLSACQLHLQQRAHALLAVCPGLPGFCPRSGAPDAPSTQQAPYLKPGGPGDAQMAQQNAAVATFIAGPGFQERLSQLQQLPDKQGILIAAGKPHHVGNAAIMLHVSCHNQAAVGCREAALCPQPHTQHPALRWPRGLALFLVQTPAAHLPLAQPHLWHVHSKLRRPAQHIMLGAYQQPHTRSSQPRGPS